MSKPHAADEDRTRIGVLGAGAWGTALATLQATKGCDVLLWGRDANTVEAINTRHRNPAYLGDIALSPHLRATTQLDDLTDRTIWLWVTPAQSINELARQVASLTSQAEAVVLCAKGIDKTTAHLPHETAAHHFGEERVFALSGPSFASDVARGLPTAVSLAGPDMERAAHVARQLAGPWFRIYASDDLTGVEAGGALKNVMALAVGIVRGLGLGASAEAALIARGFAELSRLAVALGGRLETLSGLSGLGDLVLTCSSPQSRNFAYGVALAEGADLTGRPLAEGVHTAHIALQLAREHRVAAPIIEAIVDVLGQTLTPRDAVSHLLERPLRSEG